MPDQNIFSSLFIKAAKALLSVAEKDLPDINKIKRVLVIRQHNQFGDLLASVPLFRAIKETLPECKLTVITSPQNYYALTNNKFIDEQFIFDKEDIFNIEYLYKLINVLRKGYDLVVVPATVSISTTSCLLGRFARAHFRVGPKSLDGKENFYSFLFNKKIALDWIENPDRHVADFGLDILRPLGISTNNYKSEITIDEYENNAAVKFMNELTGGENYKVVGLHIGAGKPQNRWAVENFVNLCEKINQNYKSKFYITGSSSDNNEIGNFQKHINFKCGFFLNKAIPELAAVISKSDLFITNDTGVMHVAGATDVPQISLFGPTNPNNWAPIGNNKISLRKSNSINDIKVEEVYKTAEHFLNK